MTAAELIEMLDDVSGQRDFPNITVLGDLDFSHQNLLSHANFKGSVFTGAVKFCGTKFKGNLDLSDTVFIKGADLTDITVEGLNLNNTISKDNVCLDSATANAVNIRGAYLCKNFTAKGAKLGKRLGIPGSIICNFLGLENIRVEDLELAGTKVMGSTSIASAVVKNLNLARFSTQGLFLNNTRVKGCFKFHNLKTEGPVQYDGFNVIGLKSEE